MQNDSNWNAKILAERNTIISLAWLHVKRVCSGKTEVEHWENQKLMMEGNHFKEEKLSAQIAVHATLGWTGTETGKALAGQERASEPVPGIRVSRSLDGVLTNWPVLLTDLMGWCVPGIQVEQMTCSNKIWLKNSANSMGECFFTDGKVRHFARDESFGFGATGLVTVKRKTWRYLKKLLFFCSRLESFLPLLKPFDILFIRCLWIN